MDFHIETNLLTARVTLAGIAEACGSGINSIERVCLNTNSRYRREPSPY
jgi:hypothetical protein